jgi:hypothetical protein
MQKTQQLSAHGFVLCPLRSNMNTTLRGKRTHFPGPANQVQRGTAAA